MENVRDNKEGIQVLPSVQSSQETNVKGSIFKAVEYATAGIVLGLCSICIVFVVLNYFNILQLSRSIPFLSILPHKMYTDSFQLPQQNMSSTLNSRINICLDQHQGYPSLSDILTTKSDPNLGKYQGVIKKINAAEQSLTVASTLSGNRFVFNVKTIPGSLYDIHHTTITNLADIQIDTKTIISFPCLQQNGMFTITQVQMLL